MSGNLFGAYIEPVLAPILAAGDVVVTDSLPAHKAAGVRDVIKAAGTTLLFLLPTVPTSAPSKTPSARRQ